MRYPIIVKPFLAAMIVFTVGCTGTIRKDARPLEAARYLEEAKAAWGRGELQTALQAYQSAVDADPNNPEIRASRANFLTTIQDAAADQKSRKNVLAVARADYHFIIQAVPDTQLAAMARDALALLDNKVLVQGREFSCSEAALKENERAHQLFMAGRYREAAPYFQKAITLCPDNAHIWIQYGHTSIFIGEVDLAKKLLLEGLIRDEWNRAGHRFLADLEVAQGNLETAYNIAILAVISDPTYESGWTLLRDITKSMGGQWNRVVNQRPSVSLGPERNPRVVVPFDINTMPKGEVTFWLGLGLLEASELKQGRDSAASADVETGRNPLEIERHRVEKNLEHCRVVLASSR